MPEPVSERHIPEIEAWRHKLKTLENRSAVTTKQVKHFLGGVMELFQNLDPCPKLQAYHKTTLAEVASRLSGKCLEEYIIADLNADIPFVGDFLRETSQTICQEYGIPPCVAVLYNRRPKPVVGEFRQRRIQGKRLGTMKFFWRWDTFSWDTDPISPQRVGNCLHEGAHALQFHMRDDEVWFRRFPAANTLFALDMDVRECRVLDRFKDIENHPDSSTYYRACPIEQDAREAVKSQRTFLDRMKAMTMELYNNPDVIPPAF